MVGFISAVRSSANGLLIRAAIIATIGGLLFGYDTGVISRALLFIKQDLHANATAQEWIVSVLLLGAIVGAFLSRYLTDKISRRWTKVNFAFRGARWMAMEARNSGTTRRNDLVRGEDQQVARVVAVAVASSLVDFPLASIGCRFWASGFPGRPGCPVNG
ncbi:hypothetical protein GCM10028798_28780 [Humibacter antri]